MAAHASLPNLRTAHQKKEGRKEGRRSWRSGKRGTGAAKANLLTTVQGKQARKPGDYPDGQGCSASRATLYATCSVNRFDLSTVCLAGRPAVIAPQMSNQVIEGEGTGAVLH